MARKSAQQVTAASPPPAPVEPFEGTVSAILRVERVEKANEGTEVVYFQGQPDEDNNFGANSKEPCVNLQLTVDSPALLGKFIQGQCFSISFIEVDPS